MKRKGLIILATFAGILRTVTNCRFLQVGAIVSLIFLLGSQAAEGFLPGNSRGSLQPLAEYQSLTNEGRRKLRETEFGRYLAYLIAKANQAARTHQRYRYGANSYGAALEVPFGSYNGNGIVGIEAQENFDENGAYIYGYDRLLPGLPGRPYSARGWNFEPIQILSRKFDIVDSYVYSYDHQPPDPQRTQVHDTSCTVAVRYQLSNAHRSTQFRSLAERKGSGALCEFSVRTYASLGDPNAQMGASLCSFRAAENCPVENYANGDFWSDDGQLLLRAEKGGSLVVLDAEGAQTGFGRGHAPWEETSDGGPYYMSAGVFDSAQGALGWVDRVWYPLSSADRNGLVTTYGYNAGGFLESITDPHGRATRYEREEYRGRPGVGALRRIVAPGPGGSSLTYELEWEYRSWDPFVFEGECQPVWWDPRVCRDKDSFSTLKSLRLPDGRYYRFEYGRWGNLTRVEYPDGAVRVYQYVTPDNPVFTLPPAGYGYGPGFNSPAAAFDERRLVSETVYANGIGQTGFLTRYEHYLIREDAGPGRDSRFRHFRHTVFPDGSVLRAEYAGGPMGCTNPLAGPLREERWQGGAGVQPLSGPGSWKGENLLEALAYTYAYELPASLEGFTLNCNDPVLFDRRIKQIDHFRDGVNWVEKFEYDTRPDAPRTLGNKTRQVVSDGQGRILRDAQARYVRDSGYLRQNLIRLPGEKWVADGQGRILSRTAYRYEEYPLEASGAKNLDPNVGNVRGNLTSSRGYASAESAGEKVVTQTRYYDTGDVFQVTDPRGNTTTMQYDFGVCSGNNTRLETTVTSPVPDPSRNSPPHVMKTVTDCYTGKVLEKTDPNSLKTRFVYDGVERLLQAYLPGDPDGQPSEWYEYYTLANGAAMNTQRVVKHFKDGTAEGLGTASFNDGLGRTWRAGHRVGANSWSVTDTAYDFMGRVGWVSTPYLTDDLFGKLNPAGQWTTTEYDALGRVISVTTPDGARVTTLYRDGAATVTDPAGRQRKFVYDALQRLVQVIEDPGGLAYVTDYQYDALGNLRAVEQGTQRRYFMYDSLSRLIRAKNREQVANSSLALQDPVTGNAEWSASYEYDENGNLKAKTDARGIKTFFEYDALNRNTAVSYSDGQTHRVERTYDGAPNGRGRPSYRATYDPARNNQPVSKTEVESYDSRGRVSSQKQYFGLNGSWSKPYGVNQEYDPTGKVVLQVYPSGHRANYAYDPGGRLSSFQGTLGDGVSRVYSDRLRYHPAGPMTHQRLGTAVPLYQNTHYNNRLQPYDIRLGAEEADEWTWNRGALRIYFTSDLAYGYGGSHDSGTHNNGSVYRMDHFIPLDDAGSGWAMSIDYYWYDPLNRVLGMAENKISSADPVEKPVFTQQYKYDRYGNRTIDGEKTTPGGVVNNKVFQVEEATNRLKAVEGLLEYDAAGNIIRDTASGPVLSRFRDPVTRMSPRERRYDGGNRMTDAAGMSGLSRYTYDADGRRVKKVSNGEEWWYVYGIQGELVAEYKANVLPETPLKEYGYRGRELLVTAEGNDLKWLIADHLGTPRMVVDQTGNLPGIRRHDYLPFGEEAGPGGGIREESSGYGADFTRQKFTGKERDPETGLDWFGPGRYYVSAQGRFASTDPLNIPGLQRIDPKKFQQVIRDPHNWNGYAYAHNNPLSKLDPDGFLTIIVPGTWNSWKDWNSSLFKVRVGNSFGEEAIVFKWSGGDSRRARSQAAKELNAFINQYMKDHPGEKINLVAHSHGGNVVFEASKTTQHRFHTVVTLGTPIRGNYQPNHQMISYHLNVYSTHDMVQINGGRSPYNPALGGLGTFYGEFGPAGRTINHPMVYNLDASQYANGHSELWTNLSPWVLVVEPALKK